MPTRHVTRPDDPRIAHLTSDSYLPYPSATAPAAAESSAHGNEKAQEEERGDLQMTPSLEEMDDNTARGMSQSQEDLAYVEPSGLSGTATIETVKATAESDSMEAAESMCAMSDGSDTMIGTGSDHKDETPHTLSTSPFDRTMSWTAVDTSDQTARLSDDGIDNSAADEDGAGPIDGSLHTRPRPSKPSDLRNAVGTEPDFGTKPWSFSNVSLSSRYPCALLIPGSRFEGTQHSDHQVYNVMVSILAVDVPQCTLSGYLKIEGLTPDHPTLTTFFQGEIIGGPNQRYSFQTRHATWGATERSDLVHWSRFPAWRPLNREARRDLNFEYPIPGSGLHGDDSWWQQQFIFMRWKEEFLVPDHRVRSIQGASFEGFYYICFDQIEGKVSGIYFHARSEK